MFDRDKPIHNEDVIFRALDIKRDNLLAVRGLRGLAWKGERLQKRYENACNYAWATGDSYQNQTTMIEKATRALARDLGLHCFIQTDPCGAPIYVSQNGPITDTTYNVLGVHCIFYEDDK